ncbi:MAG: hypothetical protein H0W70_03935 [Actinobacteria bacterium]|nr:hypothetical protein [Actinomycetota bacterium]
MKRLLIVLAAVFAATGATGIGAAHAQTTTTAPCGSGTPNACGFDRQSDLGNKTEGETFNTNSNCGFEPGSSAARSFNGAALDNKNADASGCVATQITVLSDGVALARPLFAAIGLAQANGVPQVRIDGRTLTANQLGVRNALVVQGRVPGPAANPGKWTNYFTIVGPAGKAVSGGALSRTGAMIVRWSLLGAALVAIGALFVLASRRRRHA